MNRTSIEWTNALPGVPGFSWNPVKGCTKISPACTNCYAERMAHRLAGMGAPGYDEDDPFKVVCMKDRLTEPSRYTVGGIVFVVSMGDWLHADVEDWFIVRMLVAMHEAPQHFFLTLTKRAERLRELPRIASDAGVPWPLPNVGLGVTAENQEMADQRVPHLLRVPAELRFLSIEPMLSPVDLWRFKIGHEYDGEGAPYYDALRGASFWSNGEHGIGGGPTIDWVLCGGESGPGARPMHPEWARSLLSHCSDYTHTPFLFKQWGEHRPSFRGTTQEYIGSAKVGKKAAGRLLDGVEHNGVPEIIQQHFRGQR